MVPLTLISLYLPGPRDEPDQAPGRRALPPHAGAIHGDIGRCKEIQGDIGRYRHLHGGYQRVQAGNANFKRLLGLPTARELLAVLGFVEREGGATWQWRAAASRPAHGALHCSEAELAQLRGAHNALQAALARLKPAEPDAH
jgi:hypothetical protein